MADPGQTKLNEFYLLHTHPTKVFRRVKGVDIEVIQVGNENQHVVACHLKNKRTIWALVQRLDFGEEYEKKEPLVAVTKKRRSAVVEETKEWSGCVELPGFGVTAQVAQKARLPHAEVEAVHV